MASPAPLPESDNAPFWDAVARRELIFQSCEECGQAIFYPRARCPGCFSDRLAWRPSAGRGTVYAPTVVHRAPRGFEDLVPYCVALVELDEGFRMMSNVVGCPPRDVHVGMPVEVTFEERGGRLLPLFRPREPAAA